MTYRPPPRASVLLGWMDRECHKCTQVVVDPLYNFRLLASLPSAPSTAQICPSQAFQRRGIDRERLQPGDPIFTYCSTSSCHNHKPVLVVNVKLIRSQIGMVMKVNTDLRQVIIFFDLIWVRTHDVCVKRLVLQHLCHLVNSFYCLRSIGPLYCVS